MGKEETLLYFADKIISLCEREDLKRFDGFMPLQPEIYEGPERDGFFTDVTTDVLFNPVDVAIYTPGRPEGATIAKRTDQLCRLKSLSRREFRKKTGAFSLRPYQLEVAFEGKRKTTDGFLEEVNKKFKYFEVGGYITVPQQREYVLQVAQILLGVQFNLENQCYVYLKPDRASIGFKYPLNDLQQVKELFSLRDIPDGYKRRVALRHWVARHMRRKPTKPNELVEVKRHLRGKQDFKWFGMSGTIYVNT